MIPRYLFFVLIIAVVAGGAFVLLPGGAEDPSVDLVVLFTSDLHGQVEPYWNETGSLVGGFSRIAATSAAIGATADGALLLSAGDDLTGPLYSRFGGEPELRAMTLAGYDAACPGNHEFDYGAATYWNATPYAGYPVVSANLVPAGAVQPSVVLDTAGVKVGVFGLMTPDLPRLSLPGDGVVVDPNVTGVAARTVADLREQGAEIVIALTHTGAELDREVARSVAGIDLIVGGHDHIYVNETVEGPGGWETVIVSDGTRGERLGVFRFTYAGAGIEDPSWEWVFLDNTTPADPAVDAFLAPYLLEQAVGNGTVGTLAAPLDLRKSTVRGGEAAAGNLIADAWRAALPGVDIAFANGGSIRGDTILPAGPLSHEDLETILPFENRLVAVNLTGRQVQQALEVSAAALSEETSGVASGAFLQVSGLACTIDAGATPYTVTYDGDGTPHVVHPGNRVKTISITSGDTAAPLDENRTYQVVMSEFTAGGGDGYDVFERAAVTALEIYDIDPVLEYLREASPAAPVVEGRITVINAT
jgi:2',3'-cyclic-nucleotide 2'-phosphodiesterase (5'-nucleotidase family)